MQAVTRETEPFPEPISETIIQTCPRCDSVLSDLNTTDQRYHLRHCRAVWVQTPRGQWGTMGRLEKPDTRQCQSCGTTHDLRYDCPHIDPRQYFNCVKCKSTFHSTGQHDRIEESYSRIPTRIDWNSEPWKGL